MGFFRNEPFFVLLLILSGIFLSLISEIIVFLLLSMVKFKDFSTDLRLFATLNDFLFSVCLIFFVINVNEVEDCYANFGFALSSVSHSFWIFYMSFAMYEIIHKKKVKKRTSVKYAFFINFLISLLMSSVNFIPNNNQPCLFSTISTTSVVIFELLLIFPNVFLFSFSTFFYIQIRKTLTDEIQKIEKLANIGKILFKRIYFYQLIFVFDLIANFLLIFQLNFPQFSNQISLSRLIIYGFYPFFNSLLYGMTQSTKEYLKAIVFGHTNYLKKEYVYHELREQGFILPRFYLDLIGKNENDMI